VFSQSKSDNSLLTTGSEYELVKTEAAVTDFRRNIVITYVWVSLVVMMVIIVAATALHGMRQRADVLTASTTQNLALLMEQTYDGMIDSIDVALQSAADDIGLHMREDPQAITSMLTKSQKRLQYVAYLRATDEQGNVIYGAGARSPPVNNSDRDYFITLRDKPNAGLFISKALLTRTDKRWVWLFGRRISRPDGSFSGVVYATIFLEDLDAMLGRIVLQSGGVATLRDADIGVLARHVTQGPYRATPGERTIAAPFAAALKIDPDQGTYVSGGTSIDKINRTQTYRRSAKYGYYVNVGVSSEQALEVWQRQVWLVTLLVSMFVAASTIFALHVRRSWLRREKDVRALETMVQDKVRLNADLERFAYVTSHHLQEPTRRIVIFSQRLQTSLGQIEDADITASMAFLHKEGIRLRSLLHDVELYLDAGRPHGPIESQNTSIIADKAIQALDGELRQINADIEVSSLPPVLIDSRRLREIFIIALKNSITYRCQDRPLRIRISGATTGRDVVLRIEDNSTGIPAAYRERVFRAFERMHPQMDETSTGVGLAILRRIAESMGGNASIEDGMESGITVVIKLPSGGLI